MTGERLAHTQQTLLALADEFLIQYFICGHREFRSNQILSRLFSMGHSLELYAKAALVSHEGIPPTGHNVPVLLQRLDPTLGLSAEEISAGRGLFKPGASNIDEGVWLTQREAMELYQALYFLPDLKYYLGKNGNVIFPARLSLLSVNLRFLDMARRLRSVVRYPDPIQDRTLIDLIEHLGFEQNPARLVVS